MYGIGSPLNNLSYGSTARTKTYYADVTSAGARQTFDAGPIYERVWNPF